MTAIWRDDGTGWAVMPPAGFPDEATLHSLVEEAPHLLPLAGSPRLVILGREVQLGSGYADLIAVEPSGRLVVIEIKLAKNSDVRRAVIAQVLTYAAYLDGLSVEVLEREVLARHLAVRGYADIEAAVSSGDQAAATDLTQFRTNLEESLAQGQFRLVIVLDAAPDELVRLTGFLAKTANILLIDLIAVSSYDVNGSRLLVPQRLDAERPPVPERKTSTTAQAGAIGGTTSEGAADWWTMVESAPETTKPQLRLMGEWAENLQKAGLVHLSTYSGKGRKVLLPRLPRDEVGLVSIFSDAGGYICLWRSVIERTAPALVERIEQAIAPLPLKQGNNVRHLTPELLDALTDAYVAARESKPIPIAATPVGDTEVEPEQ